MCHHHKYTLVLMVCFLCAMVLCSSYTVPVAPSTNETLAAWLRVCHHLIKNRMTRPYSSYLAPSAAVLPFDSPRLLFPSLVHQVRDLLSCGLGLLACLCSCVPTEPDVPKALVKSGLLPDFLSTVVHPLLLPDPHSDPGEKKVHAQHQCRASAWFHSPQ